MHENPTSDSPLENAPAPWTRVALVGGFVAITLGGWLLLDSMGVRLPPLGRHWPIFVLLGGIASFLDFQFVSRRAGALGLGVLGLGCGALFYGLSLGKLRVTAIDDWGPVIPLVIGLAFLATWSASEVKSNAHLVLATAGIAIALLFWGWQLIELQLLWGVGLLAIGGFFVWKALSQRK